jgi:hypothetical protein
VRDLSRAYARFRARNLVERFFNKIKQCRRIATRYDKLAANYLADLDGQLQRLKSLFGLDSRQHAGAGQQDRHDPWRHLPDGKQQKAAHGERKIPRSQDRTRPDRAIEGGT